MHRAYLSLKLVELLLRLTILRLHLLYVGRSLYIACLKLRNSVTEFRYGFLVIIHNLILYYRNNNDGGKPPNDES
jgi:hypothetical protein